MSCITTELHEHSCHVRRCSQERRVSGHSQTLLFQSIVVALTLLISRLAFIGVGNDRIKHFKCNIQRNASL